MANCDCGCKCDPFFIDGLGELPRPQCSPLDHPKHHSPKTVEEARKRKSKEDAIFALEDREDHEGQSA